MATLENHLNESAWFRGLDQDARSRVVCSTIERTVAAGGRLCRKGEKVEHWLGVVSGLVKICSDAGGGRGNVATVVPAGGWFGEGSLLKDEPRRYDAIAMRATRALCVPRDTFEWLCASSFSFNRFLLCQLNERCSQFLAMLECERLQQRDSRVAQCLSTLLNDQLYPGAGPRIEISQEEIGRLAGISRPHVNRALRRLEKEGLVRIGFRGVTVVDIAGLRRFAD